MPCRGRSGLGEGAELGEAGAAVGGELAGELPGTAQPREGADDLADEERFELLGAFVPLLVGWRGFEDT